ncbi:hypothetical protein D3C81_634890 [compost metagenome]
MRAVGRRGILQQLSRGFAVQAGADRGGVLQLVATLWVIARQFIAGPLQLVLPVGQFGLQGFACSVALQVLGPRFERAGLGRQVHRLPLAQRLVGLLQVLQQQPPRHTVHHQVVNHQQQSLAAIWQPDQQRP